MKYFFLTIIFGATAWADCSLPRSEYFLKTDSMIKYIRVHPDGNALLASHPNHTASIVLLGADTKFLRTPMRAEAYPVEGTWEFISSPYNMSEMSFYRYQDLLNNGETPEKVKTQWTDTDFKWFYHSVAETGRTKKTRNIRIITWENQTRRDYKIHVKKTGEVSKVEFGPLKRLCQNLLKKADENLARKLEMESDRLRPEQEAATKSKDFKKEDEIRTRREELNRKAVAARRDWQLIQPILSKDGKYLAGQVDGTTRIFEIAGDNCVQRADLGYPTSKVSFAYPRADGKPPQITYTVEGGAPVEFYNAVVVYDPLTKKDRIVSAKDDNPNYPGFTKDGQVVYVGQYGKEQQKIISLGPIGSATCTASDPNKTGKAIK